MELDCCEFINLEIMGHLKARNNLLGFAQRMGILAPTKKNLLWFFENVSKSDELEKTEFELSFKINKGVLNRREIRLLNMDAGVYSYYNSLNFLKRLLFYKKLVWRKTGCVKKKEIFKALENVAKTPVDLYGGADFFNEDISFIFWLVLGGAEKKGKIKFIKDPDVLMNNVFLALQIKPSFKAGVSDILNIGFELNDTDPFYEIYYVLNSKTELFIANDEQRKVLRLKKLLDDKVKHWFFVSERYRIKKKVEDDPEGRKIYLEFLDQIHLSKEETYEMVQGIFNILGCSYDKLPLKEVLSSIDGRIVIIAFDGDGLVEFYIRI